MNRALDFIKNNLVIFFALLIILGILGYFSTFWNQPNGIHFIRQVDSISFALNYLLFGDSFFEPSNFNLSSDGGKALSEFPILYYLSSKIALLGANPYIALRIIHAVIFFCGVVAVFRCLISRAVPWWIALLNSLLLITSTIILYYSNNFLPDIAALGLTLVGIAYSMSANKKRILIAVLFFTLASLIKVTFAIYPIAFFTILFFSRHKYDVTIGRVLVAALLFAVVVGTWWTYVHFYNSNLNNTYYANRAAPFWASSELDINETKDHVVNYWWKSYYPTFSQYYYLLLLIALPILFKKIKKEETFYFLLSLLGCLSFILLFFAKFKDHDYYFLTIVPIISILILVVVPAITRTFTLFKQHILVGITTGIVFLSSLVYVHTKLPKRWQQVNSLAETRRELGTIRHHLDHIDPLHQKRVLIIGDSTMNGILSYIERKGYGFPTIPKEEKEFITDAIVKDSDYLLVLNGSYNEQPIIQGLNLQIQSFPALIEMK